jgi:GTPase SAR1 family protein
MHSPASPLTPSEIIESFQVRELPVRQGALSAEAIRAECPQFRILVIGKANAGKTTVLRKVCNAKPDAKPVIHDAKGNPIVYNAEGKEVQQEIPTKVRLGNLSVLAKTNHKDLGLSLIASAVLAI